MWWLPPTPTPHLLHPSLFLSFSSSIQLLISNSTGSGLPVLCKLPPLALINFPPSLSRLVWQQNFTRGREQSAVICLRRHIASAGCRLPRRASVHNEWREAGSHFQASLRVEQRLSPSNESVNGAAWLLSSLLHHLLLNDRSSLMSQDDDSSTFCSLLPPHYLRLYQELMH